MIDDARLQQEIIDHEGGIILKPYKDHLGNWTIGAGHLVKEREKNEFRFYYSSLRYGRLRIWSSSYLELTHYNPTQHLRLTNICYTQAKIAKLGIRLCALNLSC